MDVFTVVYECEDGFVNDMDIEAEQGETVVDVLEQFWADVPVAAKLKFVQKDGVVVWR